ncbi:16S rRNA (guanine(966)-N(2))-methyltransferase RsmD [Neisseria sp. Ec49-e6-T10]|uniref:16S rRNA (guanine(966)-N(2))-methyltransferase RsmD n=1 Tax=Neisseria sp. Ec49-e6-T10 TaxID=3140744 RepID=UPI003EB8D6DC
MVKKKSNNQIRIIGGTHKRSLIHFPSIEGLRPTPDRVRETLFNWLGQDLTGQVILDLFAGSGALGFEAASRGAKKVTLIECNAQIVRMLLENQHRLQFDQIDIIKQDALSFLKKMPIAPYNIIFLDPPFNTNCWDEIWKALLPIVKVDTLIYVEAPFVPQIPASFEVIRSGCAGQSKQWLLNVVESDS